MTREELEKKFIELGLPEGAARIYAEKEQQNKKIAWLAGYHFVYGLNEIPGSMRIPLASPFTVSK